MVGGETNPSRVAQCEDIGIDYSTRAEDSGFRMLLRCRSASSLATATTRARPRSSPVRTRRRERSKLKRRNENENAGASHCLSSTCVHVCTCVGADGRSTLRPPGPFLSAEIERLEEELAECTDRCRRFMVSAPPTGFDPSSAETAKVRLPSAQCQPEQGLCKSATHPSRHTPGGGAHTPSGPGGVTIFNSIAQRHPGPQPFQSQHADAIRAHVAQPFCRAGTCTFLPCFRCLSCLRQCLSLRSQFDECEFGVEIREALDHGLLDATETDMLLRELKLGRPAGMARAHQIVYALGLMASLPVWSGTKEMTNPVHHHIAISLVGLVWSIRLQFGTPAAVATR